MQVLDWFVAEGFPLDWRAAAEAAKWREDPAVCAWVRQQQHRQLHRQLAGMSAGAGAGGCGGGGARDRLGPGAGRKSGGSNHGRQGSHQGAVAKAGSRGSAHSKEQEQLSSQRGGGECDKAGQEKQAVGGAVQVELGIMGRDTEGGEKGRLVGGEKGGGASELSCGGEGGKGVEVDEGCMAGLVVWLRAVTGALWGGGTAEERTALRGQGGAY